MEALIENAPETAVEKVTQNPSASRAGRVSRYGLNAQAVEFGKARFGWMAILLTFQSCLGAVACLHISINDTGYFALACCAAVTMGSNALFIALAPAKICMAGFYTSVLVNLLLILACF